MTKQHDERRFAAARFWPKVRITKVNACWEWSGPPTWNGYGMFKFRGLDQGAHRVAWILTVGEIPEGTGYHGTCVLHGCDNRICVNPRHLFLGSHQQNMDDREKKARGNRPAKVARVRFTERDILKMRSLVASGMKQVDVAKQFNMGRSALSAIINRKRWGWV